MQEFLKTVGIKGKNIAKKSLGQNFLVNEVIVQKIVDEIFVDGVPPYIVEIGCGLGSLTKPIVEKGGFFLGIEKDSNLCEELLLLEFHSQAKIVNEDALSFDFASIPQNATLISNLPYNVGTRILVKASMEGKFSTMVIMLQKDVVEKILSKPQTKIVHPLGIFFKTFATSAMVCNVPPSAFVPMPSVVSSVVKIVFNAEEINNGPTSRRLYWDFLQKAFMHRRKAISTVFTNSDIPNEIGRKRAEELSLEEFHKLFRIVSNVAQV